MMDFQHLKYWDDSIASTLLNPKLQGIWFTWHCMIMMSYLFSLSTSAMASTPDNKSTRPVSAPVMSPVSPGEASPSPLLHILPRHDHHDGSTPKGRRSADRKAELKKESHQAEHGKSHSPRPESTPEIKVVTHLTECLTCLPRFSRFSCSSMWKQDCCVVLILMCELCLCYQTLARRERRHSPSVTTANGEREKKSQVCLLDAWSDRSSAGTCSTR